MGPLQRQVLRVLAAAAPRALTSEQISQVLTDLGIPAREASVLSAVSGTSIRRSVKCIRHRTGKWWTPPYSNRPKEIWKTEGWIITAEGLDQLEQVDLTAALGSGFRYCYHPAPQAIQ